DIARTQLMFTALLDAVRADIDRDRLGEARGQASSPLHCPGWNSRWRGRFGDCGSARDAAQGSYDKVFAGGEQTVKLATDTFRDGPRSALLGALAIAAVVALSGERAHDATL